VTAEVRGREQELAQLRTRVEELERNRELPNAIANTSPSLLCLIDGTGRFRVSGTGISERIRQAEELRRSRSRIFAARDEARKRLERNLHDGAQQHLVALLLSLKLLRRRLEEEGTGAALDRAIDELQQAIDEFVELARGIHPATLALRGPRAAVDNVARRVPLPVTVETPDRRYPQPVETAAYYVVSEALANAAKYAEASEAAVRIRAAGGTLVVEVADNGVGGADPAAGSGPSGLANRVASLDGTLSVDCPPGSGTRVTASIPIG
jgi:signal transduction histidine kinase